MESSGQALMTDLELANHPNAPTHPAAPTDSAVATSPAAIASAQGPISEGKGLKRGKCKQPSKSSTKTGGRAVMTTTTVRSLFIIINH